jgi:exonuclease SbcC
MKNIKSYKESDGIVFSQGINAICGPNGVGKSTILEAIGFALFDARAHKTNNFIREGEKKGEITVSFIDSMDEREYQAVRPVGSGTPYIYDPEIKRKIVTGKDDYFTWLKDHMEVSATADLNALFADAVGVPQGNLTAVFSETPRIRKSKFDPLLQVEDYESAWKQLRTSISQLESQSHLLETNIASLHAKLERLPSIQEDEKKLINVIEEDEVEQEKMADELKQTFEKKTNLDELEILIQNTKNQIENLQSKINGLIALLEDSKKSVEEAVKAKNTVDEVKEGYVAYKRAQAALKELETQRLKRDELREKLAETSKSIALSQQSIDGLNEQLTEITKAESLEIQLKPKVEKQEELETQLKYLEKSKNDLENTQKRNADERNRLATLFVEKEELVKKIGRLVEIEKELEELDDDRQRLTEKEASISAYFDQANIRRIQIKERITILDQTEGAMCPVCQQELDEQHAQELEHKYQQEFEDIGREESKKRNEQSEISSELKQNLLLKNQLEKERGSLPSRSRASKIEEDIKKQETVISEWAEKEKDLASVPDQIADIEKNLGELGNPRKEYTVHKVKADERSNVEDKLGVEKCKLKTAKDEQKTIKEQLQPFADLDTNFSAQQQELETYHKDHKTYLENILTADKLAEREKKVGEIEDEIKNKSEIMKGLLTEFEKSTKDYDEEEHKKTKNNFQELNSKNAALTVRILINKENLEKIQKEISELLPLIKDLEKANEEYKLLQRLHDVLVFIRTVIREAGPHITRQLVRYISLKADKIYGDILNDYSTRLDWDEEYEITIETQGKKREFSQLSGGEKMVAALAVRLSLLRYMSGISLAFFDEPTAHLDVERRTNLSNQITQVKGFDQLFVISHDDTFERDIHHVIRISKDGGVSQVEVGIHATIS